MHLRNHPARQTTHFNKNCERNVPIHVALKYNGGKVSGVRRSNALHTHRFPHLVRTAIVKKKIDEFGIGRGELFTITKAQKKNGTRRTIE